MKIGFDAKRVFFNRTGLGNHNRRFVEAFLDKKSEAEVVLFSPKSARKSPFSRLFDSKKVEIVEPSGIFRLFGGAIWRSFFLKNEIEKSGIDAFVGLSNELPFFISRLPNVRKIVVVHDLIFLRFPKFYPRLDRFFYRLKTKNACRTADFVVAVSEQTRADLIEFLGVEASKIRVVPPAIEPIFYQNFATKARRHGVFFEKKGRGERPFLLSVGSITERKNLLATVRAFEKIASKKAVDLVVVGQADSKNRAYLAKIHAFLAEKGLSERVHFLEKTASEDLPELFSAAQIFVYPSFFEGFGMPIAEALFSGTPVVCSDAKWAREAAGGGAIFVDPNDPDAIAAAIFRLLDEPDFSKNLAEAGRIWVEKFRADRVGEQIRGLFFG